MIAINGEHGCISHQSTNFAKRGYIMARITVTIPENIHQQVLKIAGKENDSISYTVSHLIEIGLMVMNSEKNKDEPNVTELDEYCQKLIIQINGIIKAIAVDQFHFDNDKIAKITSDTLVKYNQLKGTQPTSL